MAITVGHTYSINHPRRSIWLVDMVLSKHHCTLLSSLNHPRNLQERNVDVTLLPTKKLTRVWLVVRESPMH